MPSNLSRRSFLKLTGAVGGAFLLTNCQFLDGIQGIPETDLPQIPGAWNYTDDKLILDLAKLPELETLGGAVRIEGKMLPAPVLVVLGEDGKYYAFRNACTHAGRMIDPAAGTMTLKCCSLSGSTFDYQGEVLSGPAEGPLTSYPLSVEGEQLLITF